MMNKIDTLIIFAAGLGTRLRPLTNLKPKPLLEVNKKPLLFYALELTKKYNFAKIIINSHYFADQIASAVSKFISLNPEYEKKIILTEEKELLETGGTIKDNIHHFPQAKAIFTLNSDSIILPGDFNEPFSYMESFWTPEIMDMLLLLEKPSKVIGDMKHDIIYKSPNDNFIKLYKEQDVKNEILKANERLGPYTYAGLQIVKTENFISYPQKKFSIANFYHEENQPEKGFVKKIKCGIINDGFFCHLSYPHDLQKIEDFVHTMQPW